MNDLEVFTEASSLGKMNITYNLEITDKQIELDDVSKPSNQKEENTLGDLSKGSIQSDLKEGNIHGDLLKASNQSNLKDEKTQGDLTNAINKCNLKDEHTQGDLRKSINQSNLKDYCTKGDTSKASNQSDLKEENRQDDQKEGGTQGDLTKGSNQKNLKEDNAQGDLSKRSKQSNLMMEKSQGGLLKGNNQSDQGEANNTTIEKDDISEEERTCKEKICKAFMQYKKFALDLWKSERVIKIRLAVASILVVVDIITDVLNGVQLLMRGDTQGTTCGTLTLSVILLPGLCYGSGDKEFKKELDEGHYLKALILICKWMFGYPLRLAYRGIKSITDPRYKDVFTDTKCFECLVEGGLQTIITIFFIMSSEDEVSYINQLSIMSSILSVCLGCISYIQLHKKSVDVSLHWPVYLHAALSVPDVLVITVSAYPLTKTVGILFNSSNDKLVVNCVLVTLTALMGMCSTAKIYLVFISSESDKMLREVMKRRESDVKLTREFEEDIPADLFWGIQSKQKKLLFHIVNLVSDICHLTVTAVATVFLFLVQGDLETKIILSGCLTLHCLATSLDLLYISKPSLFIEFNSRTVRIIKVAESLYPVYSGAEDYEEQEEVQKFFYDICTMIDQLCQIKNIKGESIDNIINVVEKNFECKSNINLINNYIQELGQFVYELYEKDWKCEPKDSFEQTVTSRLTVLKKVFIDLKDQKEMNADHQIAGENIGTDKHKVFEDEDHDVSKQAETEEIPFLPQQVDQKSMLQNQRLDVENQLSKLGDANIPTSAQDITCEIEKEQLLERS